MIASPLFQVPYLQNPFFTGREDLLHRLYQELQTTNNVALAHPLGMSGLGGIGKTQTALEYAYRYRESYNIIFWMQADSASALTSGFAALARLLHLPEQDEQDQRIIVEAVLRWLRLHSGWLLIFDNLDSFSVAEPFLPKAGRGHILFTTRAQSLGGLASRLDVQKMEPEVGALLLLRRAGVISASAFLDAATGEDQQLACLVSQKLDGLPLALDQAGAYIEQYRQETSASVQASLQNYLSLYQEHRQELLSKRDNSDEHSPYGSSTASVATTWSLSFAKVSSADPAAAELLCLCAFLAPDAIPEEMLTDGASALGSLLFPVVTDPLSLNKSIATLRAYSLLGRNADAAMLSVHRLVQAVLQDSLSPEMRTYGMERVVHLVNLTFPSGEFVTWQACERLLSHALVGADWIHQKQMVSPEAVRLLNQAGYYLAGRARYVEAEPLYTRALEIVEQQSGVEDLRAAAIVNNLALLFQDQGRYAESEAFHRRALTTRQQQLEEQHPDIAQSMNNLGSVLEARGQYAEAEDLYQHALHIGQQQAGEQHIDTAIHLNNLANLYRTQGKYNEAEPLYTQALKIYQKHFGDTHPYTASVISNLGFFYKEKGHDREAERLYHRALTIREQTLGELHPETMNSLNNLASLYKDQDKYIEAREFYQRALAICERSMGIEHPETARILSNLADLSQDQGKYGEAEELCRRALAIRVRILGSEHAATAVSLNNLATLCERQAKYSEAEELYLHVLSIYQRQREVDNLSIARIWNNLGTFYQKIGKGEEAVLLLLQALEVYEKYLGLKHPFVANVLNNLGLLYKDQQKYSEARTSLKRALLIWEQQWGEVHLSVASCLSNLAVLYEEQGEYAEAETSGLRALSIREQLLDASHPALAYSYNNLANFYQNRGRLLEAAPLYRRALHIFEETLGSNHPSTQTVFNNYMTLIQALTSQVEGAESKHHFKD